MTNKTLRIIFWWLVVIAFLGWAFGFNPIMWDDQKAQYNAYSAEISIKLNEISDNKYEWNKLDQAINALKENQAVYKNANNELRNQVEELEWEREQLFIK